MQDYVHNLGNAVKRARGILDLSQRKLAEIAGIDARTVLDIENYRGNPKLEVLYPLVRALNLDVREIFFPEVLRESPTLSELCLSPARPRS